MNEPEASGRHNRTPFEDAIAEAMAAHDDEAPREADLLGALSRASSLAPGQWSRTCGQRAPRRYLVPLAAAASVAAIAVGSAWAGGAFDNYRPSPHARASHPVKLLRCPARYRGTAPWVPAMPVHVNGSERLVPRRVPSSAVMCAYDGTNVEKQQSGWRLSGRRVLTGGLDELAGLLSWQPRQTSAQQGPMCTQIGGGQINYLIGLTYPGGGKIWVATTLDPNYCVRTSDGEFTSFGVVGPIAHQAFTLGRWPARQPLSCHGGNAGTGRLGQDTQMVPAGSTAMAICARRSGRVVSSGYQALVSALNSLPTFPSIDSCSQRPGPQGFYQLLFSYPQGPSALVSVQQGCIPAIDNTSLQATSARTIWPIIARLLNHR